MLNSLEYVHIENDYSDGNIVHSMAISNNIDSLRYLHINHGFDKFNIALDVTNEFP